MDYEPFKGNEDYWTPDCGIDYGQEYVYLITESGEVKYAFAGDEYGIGQMFERESR